MAGLARLALPGADGVPHARDRRLLRGPACLGLAQRRRVVVDAVRASQFANAPAIAAADHITLYEEERVMGYFGGGYLYATPARQEPWL